MIRHITHLSLNKNDWSFNLHGTAIELINGVQIASEGVTYCLRYPWPNSPEEDFRFVRIGEGEFVYQTPNDEKRSDLCYILARLDSDDYFIIFGERFADVLKRTDSRNH